MKNILILTCSTGEGHNSAAYALKTELLSKGIQSELVDPIIFKGEKAKELVSSCYNNLLKRIRLYSARFTNSAIGTVPLVSPRLFFGSTPAMPIS